MEDRRVPTHLALVLDRSGNMKSQRPALLAGLNQDLALLPLSGQDRPPACKE